MDFQNERYVSDKELEEITTRFDSNQDGTLDYKALLVLGQPRKFTIFFGGWDCPDVQLFDKGIRFCSESSSMFFDNRNCLEAM